MKLWAFARHYPAFAATIIVAGIGLVLALSGLELPTRILISAFALLIAAIESIGMIKSIAAEYAKVDKDAETTPLTLDDTAPPADAPPPVESSPAAPLAPVAPAPAPSALPCGPAAASCSA